MRGNVNVTGEVSSEGEGEGEVGLSLGRSLHVVGGDLRKEYRRSRRKLVPVGRSRSQSRDRSRIIYIINNYGASWSQRRRPRQ